ncbi:MAG: helix-turn-helix domain-containing protein [Planctomycetota bacterium]|jgi:AraC-like DNA-binding protein
MKRIENNTITYHFCDDEMSTPVEIHLTESGHLDIIEETTIVRQNRVCNRVFIFETNGSFIKMNNKVFNLKAGHLYFIPIGTSFTSTYPPGSRFIFFHFHVYDKAMFEIFLRQQKVTKINNSQVWAQKIFKHYNVSINTRENNLKWQMPLFEAIYQHCLPEIPELFKKRIKYSRYDSLIDYINKNLDPGLKINDLADVFHLSRSTLSKGFKKNFGLSLQNYINSLIILRAKGKLLKTDKTIQQIAFEIGYKDPYYFYRVFKKCTGKTAVEFRKENI